MICALAKGDQAFREFNAEVIVGKDVRCVSACVYAFLGGAATRAFLGAAMR
jgi:hypothetical protein